MKLSLWAIEQMNTMFYSLTRNKRVLPSLYYTVFKMSKVTCINSD